MLLLAASACSIPGGGSAGASGSGDSERTPPAVSPSPSLSPAAPARPGGAQTAGTDAKSTVEAALNAAVRGPGPAPNRRIRTSLVDAGIPAGAVEVTAGRTPTGLAADAVEAAVRDGGNCIVAQIRNGSVVVSVLPGLASGGCLVGLQELSRPGTDAGARGREGRQGGGRAPTPARQGASTGIGDAGAGM